MAKTVICRILPTEARAAHGNNQRQGAGGIVILDVYPASGSTAWQLTTARPQDLKLTYGDTLKCVSGKAAVLINPGTPSGIFILCPRLPPNADWKIRTELEINDETTKTVHRGKISLTDDIGTILRGTGAVTR